MGAEQAQALAQVARTAEVLRGEPEVLKTVNENTIKPMTPTAARAARPIFAESMLKPRFPLL